MCAVQQWDLNAISILHMYHSVNASLGGAPRVCVRGGCCQKGHAYNFSVCISYFTEVQYV